MEDKVWSCDAGSFIGYESSGCFQITGIRYATAERYGRPVPYRYPEGTHECREPCPFCVQDEARIEGRLVGIYYQDYPQSEDCLRLSITVPDDVTPESLLPVMVWYHGGAYKNGGCETYLYERTRLVGEEKVVMVSVNYRVGMLGFVRDISGDLSNNGILDSIEGLRWVKRNISAFGGDPDNITIFGQSAGADIIRCIMLSEGTEDLYKRAIMQSPPLGVVTGREDMDRQLLEELNRYPVDISSKELIEAQGTILSKIKVKGNIKEMPFGPHHGVYPLPKAEEIPSRLKEISKDHTLLIGCNRKEVVAYVGADPKLIRLYRNPLTGWLVRRIVQKKSDDIFRNGTREFAHLYAECGGDTYLYDFHWREEMLLGSCHGFELPLLFGADGYDENSEIASGMRISEINEIGRSFRRMWADFARDGSMKVMSLSGIIDVEHL